MLTLTVALCLAAAPAAKYELVPLDAKDAQAEDGVRVSFTLKVEGKEWTSAPVSWLDGKEAQVVKAGEVVLASRRATLVVDYPVNAPIGIAIVADTPKGFTRAGLLREIGRVYRWMYAEEEASSRTPVLPPGERGRVLNRNTTHGRFGIWGHDLSDLFLEEIRLRQDARGLPLVHLAIGS